jgi:predicted amidohydrolase
MQPIDIVRVAAVQYLQKRITHFDELVATVHYFVKTLASYRTDFIVFPEFFALQLLSAEAQTLAPMDAVDTLTRHHACLKQTLQNMALQYHINIIAGSLPLRVDAGHVENICHIFLRDGSIHTQTKLHPTPSEVDTWNVRGGNQLTAITTDCGRIGVLICYDVEFPELARHLVDQGVEMIFVPFCTDERQGYLRVRYCAQARAVENQCYIVMAGNVGQLPNVVNMDMQYAQSGIFTPCDFAFARDGIAAETTPDVEAVAIADLRLDTLRFARTGGTVHNLKDRRNDLYTIKWMQ